LDQYLQYVDPLLSQQHLQNKRGPFHQQRQPRDESFEPRQRPKIPSSKSLVIVTRVEPALEYYLEVVFEGRFCNEDTKV